MIPGDASAGDGACMGIVRTAMLVRRSRVLHVADSSSVRATSDSTPVTIHLQALSMAYGRSFEPPSRCLASRLLQSKGGRPLKHRAGTMTLACLRKSARALCVARRTCTFGCDAHAIASSSAMSDSTWNGQAAGAEESGGRSAMEEQRACGREKAPSHADSVAWFSHGGAVGGETAGLRSATRACGVMAPLAMLAGQVAGAIAGSTDGG